MEESFVAPRRPILLYHRFPATLLKPGLTGKPMAKGKHRFFAKWRHTALSVGFLTIILAASAHAQGSEYIYWIEVGGGGKIRRANLDGTNPVDLIAGVNNGLIMALQIASSSSSASSASSQVRYVLFRSQYVVLALFALLGCWYVLRPH